MIDISGVLTALLAIAILFGLGTIVLAFVNWKDFRGSTYGNAFLIFGLGWIVVELHSVRELIFYLSPGKEFPTLMAAGLSTAGTAIIAASYYLIYKDTR